MIDRRTPQYLPALLPRDAHNRASAGWLSAQIKALLAEDCGETGMRRRLREILDGREAGE